MLPAKTKKTLHEWMLLILSRIAGIMNQKVYFGRSPYLVPENAVIFFPYHAGRLSCGFTGLIAFNREKQPPAIIDAAELRSRLDRAGKNGFFASKNLPPDDFIAGYLGGEAHVLKLFEAVHALKQNDNFHRIYNEPALFDGLSEVAAQLKALIQTESGHLGEQMGVVSSDQFDAMSMRIERMKDTAWCLETEILQNVLRVRDLAGDAKAEMNVFGISAARQINVVLNSIDRLEVRGRDSAGISLMFVLDDESYTAFIDDISSAGGYEEFTARTNREVLASLGITVNRDGGNTTIAMTYKVAAEIGSLGDNIRSIREQIENDPLFSAIISRPRLFFTVSAHTRWASVGAINEANCHPLDNRTMTSISAHTGIIHVCLNGDIDNYQEIKADHEEHGVRFFDDITCDTKIIPVHIEHYCKQGHPVEEAFRLAVNDFEGSHAISMHTDLAPGKFFLALKGSGQAIFIGLAPDHYIPTSEVYGFVEETSAFLKMDGEAVSPSGESKNASGQICIIDQSGKGGINGIRGMYYNGAPISFSDADIRTTQLVSRDIDRQDFNHYFLKEISEAPASVRKTLANRWRLSENESGRYYEIHLDDTCVPGVVRTALSENRIRRIAFIGQGTAGVAALVCANQLRHYIGDTDIRIDAMKSSELSGVMVHDDKTGSMDDTLLVPISQSGTTTDTNRTVDMVRKQGGKIICIVNRRDSDLTFKSDGVIYTSSGRDIEMSVASTKAFYSQIIAGAILGLFIAAFTEKRGHRFISSEIQEMIGIPDRMEKVLSMTDQIKASANRLALQRTYWAVVGSGPNKAAADEIRIKLSELCYKTISSDYVEDKKHIDLSSEPLVIVCAAGTPRRVLSDIVKDTAIFKSHKALPVVICDAQEDRFAPYAEDVFHVPQTSEHFAPILNTLVGHIWGYYAALAINEGSKFLHDFREEIQALIRTCTNKNLDIFEIALEETFREKILQFYRDFRQMQQENRLPGTIGLKGATNLTLLLKYLAGRLPVNDFEFDFGVKGTAKNMFALFFDALGESINAMARPVDAIKHQAKTVTVGTSRIEEKAEGLLFDILAGKGFGVDHLSLTNVMVLRNIQKILSGIRGLTLYRVSGVNLLGEPTDRTTITVVEKEGTSASIPSRSETDQALKGSKRIIVRQGNIYLGKGRKDDRSVLIIPIISSDPAHPNMIEHLLLLEVVFKTDVDLATRVKALGGKHEHIKNIVQENSVTWKDEYLDMLPMDDLFGRSAEKVAEMIIEKIGYHGT
ncbi:MAG: SIS domain-containing protein [Desulfosalsimonadaceae bacterium]